MSIGPTSARGGLERADELRQRTAHGIRQRRAVIDPGEGEAGGLGGRFVDVGVADEQRCGRVGGQPLERGLIHEDLAWRHRRRATSR